MNQQSANLYDLPFPQLCMLVRQHFPGYEYHYKKHAILLKDVDQNPIGSIRLPLHLVLDAELGLVSEQATVLYISIESDYASLSMMEGTENVYHTTFGAYMTRKRQGFSQVKYLKKKGKSRAGSRRRLTAALEFFESINLRLAELFDTCQIDRLALNCSTILLPYLYQSKHKCPFEKSDPRLYKIPLHIPQSNFSQLTAAIKKLKAPTLFYEAESQALMEPLTAPAG